MRVVSFDCGIKTLSFCLLDIYQFSEEDKERVNKKVKAIIKDVETLSEEIKNRIKQTMDKISAIINNKTFKIMIWKKINMCDLPPKIKNLLCNSCNKPAKFYSEKNKNKPNYTLTGYCKKHLTGSAKQIKEKKAKDISYMDLNMAIVKNLDEFPELLTADNILIENQPSKNPRMNMVQNMLYSYFVIRGIVDIKKRCIGNIINVSPKYKLKGQTFEERKKVFELFQNTTKKKKYNQRKNVSSEYTLYLLHKSLLDNKKWIIYMNENKKKQDDLADCFLQSWNCPKINNIS